MGGPPWSQGLDERAALGTPHDRHGLLGEPGVRELLPQSPELPQRPDSASAGVPRGFGPAAGTHAAARDVTSAWSSRRAALASSRCAAATCSVAVAWRRSSSRSIAPLSLASSAPIRLLWI